MTMEVLGTTAGDIYSNPLSHPQTHPNPQPQPLTERLWPTGPSAEARITIRQTLDIVEARGKGRHLSLQAGCSATELLLVQTIISELARNIVMYAGSGEIHLAGSAQKGRNSLTVTASDEGPGIANIEEAMTSGYSTSGGLGIGLPGIKQMSHQFEVSSRPGAGTKVTATIQFV